MKHGKLLLVAALAILLALPPANVLAQSEAGVFPTAPRIDRLPNGLTVVSVPWESPGIVAYYTLVRVGSRDEVEPGHSGFAHLFEHMMFRGTERNPQERYESTLQGFGASNNAYTTQDFTLYTLTAPSAELQTVVELEADRFQNLSYDEAAFRTETGAVRGEYDTHASNPFLKMWEALSELSFSQHTYGHTTLGYLRDIDAMPERYDYSRRFFRRFYTPDNTTIIAVGDVDHDRLMELVRANYGRWRGRRDQPRIPVEAAPTEGASRHIDWPAETAPRIFLGYRTPASMTGRRERDGRESLRDTAALQVVHGLAFSEPSPLYQRLMVEERRLLELGSWAGDYTRDPHLFVASATLAEGQSFDDILGAMQAEFDGFAEGELDPARVEAVKSHLRYALLSELETPTAAADLIARTIAVFGSLEMLDELLAAIAAVTPEDVARVAREYLTTDRRFVVTLSHGEAPQASPAPTSGGAQ